jgi:hypothetical protein
MCANISALPIEVVLGTSVGTTCMADFTKMCTDATMMSITCPSGSIATNLCPYYPNKCDTASSEFDTCAMKWDECLLNMNWKFCESFPEMCTTESIS